MSNLSGAAMVLRSGLLGLLLSAMVLPSAQAQLTATLTVQVEGLQDAEGNLCLKLFNGAPGFPNDNDRAVSRACVAIDAAQPFRYTFADLPAGSYAVALYHDRNGNDLLDRGAFGMPLEGYGFSNNAPAVTGPARYEDATFLLAGSQAIDIQLRYPQ